MTVLGLTGSSGSGKGEIGAFFAANGVPSLDTDRVYHELVGAPGDCTKELAAAFGKEILAPDGSLDRRALGRIVFADTPEAREKKALLEKITHAYILAACRVWIGEQRAAGKSIAVIDAPLLYESGFDRECDAVVAVTAPQASRLARICARDGIGEEAARARLAAQPSDAFYTERADYVIRNDGDLALLHRRAAEVLDAVRNSDLSRK